METHEISQTEVKLAIGIIERMQEVVRNDMLIRGVYLDSEIDLEKKEAGAICGGHRVCAIGSLWVGAGIKPTWDRFSGWYLPYVTSRYIAFGQIPGLGVAYDTLNAVSVEHPMWSSVVTDLEEDDEGGLDYNAMEELFEGTKIPPQELLTTVTEQALERLRGRVTSS